LFLVFDIHISQGSVAAHLRCGGIFHDRFIANFFMILTAEEFWNICQYLAKLCTWL